MVTLRISLLCYHNIQFQSYSISTVNLVAEDFKNNTVHNKWLILTPKILTMFAGRLHALHDNEA